MATLSTDAIKRLQHGLANKDVGNEVATALNLYDAVVSQTAQLLVAVILATNVSQTVDFAALKVGDRVVRVQATVTATQAGFYTVAVAGTLPAAAVVGDLYLVLRPLAAPTAINQAL